MRLDKIKPMTDEDYYVRGCTALLDAVGNAIHHIGNVHKYAREEDRPEKTLFVITTDGQENSSRRYSYSKVKSMVERQKKRCGWEFLFLGAKIDAAAEAGRFGIAPDRAVKYHSDKRGTEVNYSALSKAVSSVRRCDDVCEMSEALVGWDEDIREDYEERGGEKYPFS